MGEDNDNLKSAGQGIGNVIKNVFKSMFPKKLILGIVIGIVIFIILSGALFSYRSQECSDKVSLINTVISA